MYLSVVAFRATLTAHNPTSNDIISFSIWKASAMSANDWTRNPVVSSRRKKAMSMPSIMLMRVVLDHAILSVRMLSLE